MRIKKGTKRKRCVPKRRNGNSISKPEEEDTSDDSGCEYLSNGILYHNIGDDGGGVSS